MTVNWNQQYCIIYFRYLLLRCFYFSGIWNSGIWIVNLYWSEPNLLWSCHWNFVDDEWPAPGRVTFGTFRAKIALSKFIHHDSHLTSCRVAFIHEGRRQIIGPLIFRQSKFPGLPHSRPWSAKINILVIDVCEVSCNINVISLTCCLIMSI